MKDFRALVVLAALVHALQSGGAEALEKIYVVLEGDTHFSGAQKVCSALNGQLATAGFSLKDLGLDFAWIGLHRPTGCTDPAAPLHGYEWLSGDAPGQYQNWGSGFNDSCASPRCVVMDAHMKWVQRSCDAPAPGSVCEYPPQTTCEPLDEATYTLLYDHTVAVFSSGVPSGFIATKHPSATEFVCFHQVWVQAPWNCETLKGGCEHECAVHPNTSTSFCHCPPGSSIDPANNISCVKDESDPCLTLGCAHGCYEHEDAHLCLCDQGYRLAPDGRSCVDFDDCLDPRQCPEENTVCVNVPGGFECPCRDGYHRVSGGVCVDVDECASAPCEHICSNTAGGFSCLCYDGYRGDPKSPAKCKLYCDLEECPAECDPNDKYQCYCPDGFILEERVDQMVCFDIDECGSFYCDQSCTNTYGSFKCACFYGWTLVGEGTCFKNEDYDADTGSGMNPTSAAVTTPSYGFESSPTAPPSGVSVGAFVGILLCTVLVTSLLVCVLHHVLNNRVCTSRGSMKASEPEAHSL